MINSVSSLLSGNTYPGRGLIIGKTPNGKKAVTAYFIMGRSQNSRNRILEIRNGVLYTKPLDSSKVTDPSLIIYPALKICKNFLIVSNGNQTDNVFDGLQRGKSFEESLIERTYEPDKPNYTPRISGLVTFENNNFNYQLSILKTSGRFFFSYNSECGKGHLIHTYKSDGDPLPSFEGSPHEVEITDELDSFSEEIWDSLDRENRISLYVRFTDLDNNSFEDKILNK